MSDQIDFAKLGGPVFVGRANGAKARAALHLDRLDKSEQPVEVRVPSGTYSINSSYFLGLFGPSVISLGSSEAFHAHYRFEAPPVLMETIERHIDRALRERGPLRLE